MLFRIYLLSFLIQFTCSTVNRQLKVLCGLDRVTRESVSMKFYIQIQNTGNECHVECVPDKCCLHDNGHLDCDLLRMFGACRGTIPSDGSWTASFVAPILDPFEKHGYCVVNLKTTFEDHPIVEDTLSIPFSTIKLSDATSYSGDQNPLNEFQPVDCDPYYNWESPYFSVPMKKDIQKAKRTDQETKHTDQETYDGYQNNITDDNIRMNGVKFTNRKLRSSNELANETLDSLEEDEEDVDDDLEGDLIKLAEPKVDDNFMTDTGKKTHLYHTFPLNPFNILRSPLVLAWIICLQFCLVLVLLFCFRKQCRCMSDKAIVKKFFNNRHGDSVTTPLIPVSHATATTCQFMSDSSSNVNRKIKYYKSRQDKRAKASMSDDILSRCLKRRDWTTQFRSSEIIPEIEKKENGIQVYETEHRSDRTGRSSKRSRNKRTMPVESLAMEISSEQQVKCFEYEDQTFFRQYVTALQATHSLTENCVQASFPKDSIDEFMSERGITQSNLNLSESSKTSKDNVETVLSLLSQRVGQFSDPESEDLELLHMSRASPTYSSSNEEYESKGNKD